MRLPSLNWSPLVAEVAGLVVLLAILGGIWGHGYTKGKASVEADMAALRQSYAEAAAQAAGRQEIVLKAADAALAKVKEDYARDTQSLAARADTAESAYTRILREYAALASRPQVPAVAPAPAGTGGTPSDDDLVRARSASEGIGTVASSCAKDGAKLAGIQKLYESLRAVY